MQLNVCLEKGEQSQTPSITEWTTAQGLRGHLGLRKDYFLYSPSQKIILPFFGYLQKRELILHETSFINSKEYSYSSVHSSSKQNLFTGLSTSCPVSCANKLLYHFVSKLSSQILRDRFLICAMVIHTKQSRFLQ